MTDDKNSKELTKLAVALDDGYGAFGKGLKALLDKVEEQDAVIERLDQRMNGLEVGYHKTVTQLLAKQPAENLTVVSDEKEQTLIETESVHGKAMREIADSAKNTLALFKKQENVRGSKPFNRLTIHCADTQPTWFDKNTLGGVEEIRRWHTNPKPRGNGWSDIGYHFLGGRRGNVVKGRPMRRNGAHVLGENANNMGFCLFGGKGGKGYRGRSSNDENFLDIYTRDQLIATLGFIIAFGEFFELYLSRDDYLNFKFVSGHNDYTNMRTCPNFQVKKFVKNNFTTLTQARKLITQDKA